MTDDSAQRKQDHLTLCATDQVAFRAKTTLLEQVALIHRALPELALDQLDTTVEIGGHQLAAPLWIGAMTGGADGTARLNRELAALAAELGLGLCLGSLRPLLADRSRQDDFAVRDVAPDVLLLGNLGATELVRQGPAPLIDALGALGADGVALHLNPMMELIQPGGDTDFCGAVEAIGAFVEQAGELLVVVKETGCGLSWRDGELLKKAGVTHVEVAGAGGTSWVGVETLRATDRAARLGELLWDWGVPTAVSTAWMVDHGFTVIAGGGIRSGIDMARALALGARLCAVAAPLVQADRQGGAAVMREHLEELIDGLRFVMLGCGAATIEELRHVPRVIGGDLAHWIETGWQDR